MLIYNCNTMVTWYVIIGVCGTRQRLILLLVLTATLHATLSAVHTRWYNTRDHTGDVCNKHAYICDVKHGK